MGVRADARIWPGLPRGALRGGSDRWTHPGRDRSPGRPLGRAGRTRGGRGDPAARARWRAMNVDERRAARERDLDLEREALDAKDAAADADEDLQVSGFQALLQDRRKLATGFAIFLIAIVAIYVLFPKIVGFDDAPARIDAADWYWVALAIAFNVGAFLAYVTLFRGILGGTSRRDDEVQKRLHWRAACPNTPARPAPTPVFSPGGA